MARGGRSLRRRLVDAGLDVLGDRAPWLADQAYRAAATPLAWVDPGRAAEVAHARLDAVRDRVAAMAATGRVRRAEEHRIRRDLARTAEDLRRAGPRLPPVQARALAVRLEQYVRALDPGPGAVRPVVAGATARDRRRGALARAVRRRGREAAVATGAATAAWAGLMLPGAGVVAVEGGLVAGTATAVGVAAVKGRRARRERMAALAGSLAAIDAGPARAVRTPVPDLDRARREVLRRARASGRLDAPATALLASVDAHLDDLLVRLLDDDLDSDVAFLVEATVTRYLPDTLDPFLALRDPRSTVNGRPAAVEVADQLASIDAALRAARERPGRRRPETMLHLQGEFLRSKFGPREG